MIDGVLTVLIIVITEIDFKKVKKYREIICLKKISYLLLLLFELTLLTILAAMVEVKEIVARNCQTLKDDLLFLGGISGHFGSFSYPIGIYFTFLSKKLWTIDGSSNTIQSHFIFFDLTVPIHHVLLLH